MPKQPKSSTRSNCDGLPRGGLIRNARFVVSLAWPQVERLIAAGATAVLPIGAAAKEHGRHLPMASDLLQAEHLAWLLAKRANVLVWPALSYGYYPAFTDYPGSCTLDAAVFAQTVEQVAESIFRSGARALLVINTGISTIPPLESLATRCKHPIKLAHVYRGVRYVEVERKICRQERGGHGDEAETSIMLAIAPEQVNMDLAQAWLSPQMGHGKFIREDVSHPNFSPDGIYGDPTLASREKGEKLLEAMLDDLLDVFDAPDKLF
ncbi:MAG TPA: creatininase family protein [Burkholderiales bacterium]|nr:creatininase family protein [Burkholderiales bacterium]